MKRTQEDGGGRLLADRSSQQVAQEAAKHLTAKMWDNTRESWDTELEKLIADNVDLLDFKRWRCGRPLKE